MTKIEEVSKSRGIRIFCQIIKRPTRVLIHATNSCAKRHLAILLIDMSPGRRYSITPFPKFPDLPGMENRAHFSYAWGRRLFTIDDVTYRHRLISIRQVVGIP